MVSRNGNLKLPRATPVFEQQPKATKSSGEENIGLGQQANRFSHVCCVLPPAPLPPLPDCYVGHPLPSLLIPLCPPQTARWDGGKARAMLARVCAGLAAGTRHRYLQPPLSGCRCPRLLCVLGCAHKHQGCLHGCLRHRAWLPAAPLCVPLPSKAHPTLLLVRTEAASGFPSHSADGSESPGSCVSSAPSTARPGTLLGRRVTCVTSVNSLRPSLLLPGASCSPVHLCSQSPAPWAGRVVPALLCL